MSSIAQVYASRGRAARLAAGAALVATGVWFLFR
jgi:hypothetical protein